MRRIACLHTVDSNVAVFDAALASLGRRDLELHHRVRADLLSRAEREGGLTAEIATETVGVLQEMSAAADAVLLTCSTLGPAAETAADEASCPILRVDAALAAEAVAGGGTVVVLCAVETTIGPTRRLFERAASHTGATVSIELVPDAWDAFKAGATDRYHQLIAAAADRALQGGAARVALAQASMAGASRLAVGGAKVLNSPVVGLAAAAIA